LITTERISICGNNIDIVNNADLISIITDEINQNGKKVISYLTAASLNKVNCSISGNKSIFQDIDIVHPDGIGIYLASKFLYGKYGLKERTTGSDFYPHLITSGVKNGWRFFFFGDTEETLEKIRKNSRQLKIVGIQNGYTYNNIDLINEICKTQPDILVVGLGCPLQEEWIVKNKNNIKVKIIIAVGDGIKVFAGIKKRGPAIVQKLGLEWVIRLFLEPGKYWKRYIIGIPLFIYRVIKYKFQLLKEKS